MNQPVFCAPSLLTESLEPGPGTWPAPQTQQLGLGAEGWPSRGRPAPPGHPRRLEVQCGSDLHYLNFLLYPILVVLRTFIFLTNETILKKKKLRK